MHDSCKTSSSSVSAMAFLVMIKLRSLFWCIAVLTCTFIYSLRKLALVTRLILRLRLPGKARLGSESAGTGTAVVAFLYVILIHVKLEKDLYSYTMYIPCTI